MCVELNKKQFHLCNYMSRLGSAWRSFSANIIILLTPPTDESLFAKLVELTMESVL